MKLNHKVMLLGMSIILLSIACNVMTGRTWEVFNNVVGDYGHWIGFLVVILGMFFPEE